MVTDAIYMRNWTSNCFFVHLRYIVFPLKNKTFQQSEKIHLTTKRSEEAQFKFQNIANIPIMLIGLFVIGLHPGNLHFFGDQKKGA